MTNYSSKRGWVLGIESSCDETGVALFDLQTGQVAAITSNTACA
jgi:tRNA A37 threonylcarbamoyltransferase TsaD